MQGWRRLRQYIGLVSILAVFGCSAPTPQWTPATEVARDPAVAMSGPVRCPLAQNPASVLVPLGESVTLSTGLSILFKSEQLEHGLDGEADLLAEVLFARGDERSGALLPVLADPQPWRAVLGQCLRLSGTSGQGVHFDWAAP